MKMLKGVAAGAVGVWVLDRVTWFVWNRQSQTSLARERAARPKGLDPAHVIARRVSGMVSKKSPMPRQPTTGGMIAHYGLGIVPAAIYAAMRPRKTAIDLKRSVMLGLGLFVAHDEVANPVLGFSGPPWAYPWQAHARGLIGHLAYGFTVDAALAGIERMGMEREPERNVDRESTPREQPISEIVSTPPQARPSADLS